MKSQLSQTIASKKAKSACDYCRIKKAKCDEAKPCSNCVKKGISCSYNPDEVNAPSKMDKAFNHLESKVDVLDQKLSKLLNMTLSNGPQKLMTESDNHVFNIRGLETVSSIRAATQPTTTTASRIQASPAKILDSSALFSDDDLLASVVDELLPILNSQGSDNTCKTTHTSTISSLSNPIILTPTSINLNDDSDSSFSDLFLNEIFDTHSKDPYFINLFDNYDDIFNLYQMTSDSGDSAVMDISSLVDETEKKVRQPSLIKLSNIQKTVLREESYTIRGRIDIGFMNKLKDIDMSPSYAEELFESYLEHIYPFYPIVCEATIAGIKEDVNNSGLILNTSSCQYYLLLALGEVTVANENHTYWSSESYKNYTTDSNCQFPLCIPPGYDYFWIALSMMDKLKHILPNGFDTIIMQLLICVYYLKTCQLNELKRVLLEGSDMLFKFLEIEGHKHTHRDILLRLYWVFLHLERALHNMSLLENCSSLIDIQPKVSIPRGCKSNFPKDADTFYSNCYMQNILLANIDDKAKVMSVSIDDGVPFNDCLKIFIKFEYELNTWRTLLPFNFQWEDDVSIRSTHVEMDLLKLKYYLAYVTVCQFLIKEFEKKFQDVIFEDKTRPYLNQVEILIQKVLAFTNKAQSIFSRQSIVDIDPLICSHLMNSLYFIINSQIIQRYRSKYGADFVKLRSSFRCSAKKLYCFSLHSPKIDDRLQILRNYIT
jgi:hypothetical protein